MTTADDVTRLAELLRTRKIKHRQVGGKLILLPIRHATPRDPKYRVIGTPGVDFYDTPPTLRRDLPEEVRRAAKQGLVIACSNYDSLPPHYTHGDDRTADQLLQGLFEERWPGRTIFDAYGAHCIPALVAGRRGAKVFVINYDNDGEKNVRHNRTDRVRLLSHLPRDFSSIDVFVITPTTDKDLLKKIPPAKTVIMYDPSTGRVDTAYTAQSGGRA